MELFFSLFIYFISLVFFGMLLIDMIPFAKKRKVQWKDSGYHPKALVIVPCRGLDLTLKENLKSIASQDYSSYKVVAVVDAKDDPAIGCIMKSNIDYIISKYRPGPSSGKVLAILSALKKFPHYDAYVIADSDILVGKRWLHELLSPLGCRDIGISTTFPRFMPSRGFWSRVKSVWGLAGEGLMENRMTRFAWGGSLAFRNDLIRRDTVKLLKGSKYSLSDDISLTKAALARGLDIAYVRSAQPRVNSADSFSAFFEWSNRQTAFSILGYPGNLYYGIAFYSAEIILLASGVILSYAVSPVFLILLIHLVKSEIKTYMRSRSLDPEIAAIVLFMPFMYLINLVLASRTRRIVWRGRSYELNSDAC
ncbi:MAG: glycosyltransferase family 2 protein [Candidatus Micrarchaeaceae archaeon]